LKQEKSKNRLKIPNIKYLDSPESTENEDQNIKKHVKVCYILFTYIIATENRILNNYVSSINFFKNMFLKYLHQAINLKTLFININS